VRLLSNNWISRLFVSLKKRVNSLPKLRISLTGFIEISRSLFDRNDLQRPEINRLFAAKPFEHEDGFLPENCRDSGEPIVASETSPAMTD
jgi:hypothetical protein